MNFYYNNSSPHPPPGPPARHSDGRLSAVHPEHLRRDPLPQDDLVGGDRRCHWDFRHRLHVLYHGEYVTYFSPSAAAHWGGWRWGQQVDLVYPEIRSSHILKVSLKSDLKLESSVL